MINITILNKIVRIHKFVLLSGSIFFTISSCLLANGINRSTLITIQYTTVILIRLYFQKNKKDNASIYELTPHYESFNIRILWQLLIPKKI